MSDLERRVKQWKEISRPDFIGTHELIDDLLKATQEMKVNFIASLPEYVEEAGQSQPPSIVWNRIDDEAKTGQQVHIWFIDSDGQSKTIISRWLEKEQRWAKTSKQTEVLGYQLFPQPPKQDK